MSGRDGALGVLIAELHTSVHTLKCIDLNSNKLILLYVF